MPEPADKSDDLIAELAKLMAAPPGGNVQPLQRPAPLDVGPPPAPVQQAPAPGPTVIRIPGMEAPKAAAAVAPSPAPEVRTGTIRIPGMDHPAPVSTSAPVGKFDTGRPVEPPVARAESPVVSDLANRIAARAAEARPEPVVPPQPAPSPVRLPSDLRPVSENKSFAAAPALSFGGQQPAPAPAAPIANFSSPPAAQPASDFTFDFGFGSPTPPAAPQRPAAPVAAPAGKPPADPIADLIKAEMEAEPAFERDLRPGPPIPILRTTQPPQPAPRPVAAPAPAPRPINNAPIPLKPVSLAPRAPEADRFAISPGVGLNMRPPANQPLNPPPLAFQPEPEPEPDPEPFVEETDPMAEIESLIGEAVRVELSPGPVRVQAPQRVAPQVQFESEAEVEQEIHAAPIVPPLTAQYAPRRSGLKDEAASHSGAEDAILAAAAATGAQVDRIEPAVGDESPYRRLKIKPERSSFLSGGMRQYVGMAVAGTLLLAAGLGLYWVLNMGRTSATGANAPQLTADASPVKETPAPVAKTDTDAAKSPVLQQMGGASQAPSTEQLASIDPTTTTDVTRDVSAPTAGTEAGLANRKVRTVTVRPDGTIVSGDDAVAGAEELPVDRPNVPDVPSAETPNLLTGTGTTSSSETAQLETKPLLPPANIGDTMSPAQATDVAAATDTSLVPPVPMSFPVRTGSAQALAFDAPAKTPVTAVIAPSDGQTDLLAGDAPAKPAKAAPVQVANTDGGGATAYVQLASSTSAADANAAVKAATARFGDLFGGSKLVVQQVDLGQKGVKWRVRLPVSSLADASNICAQIKAQGGDCFATNG